MEDNIYFFESPSDIMVHFLSSIYIFRNQRGYCFKLAGSAADDTTRRRAVAEDVLFLHLLVSLHSPCLLYFSRNVSSFIPFRWQHFRNSLRNFGYNVIQLLDPQKKFTATNGKCQTLSKLARNLFYAISLDLFKNVSQKCNCRVFCTGKTLILFTA